MILPVSIVHPIYCQVVFQYKDIPSLFIHPCMDVWIVFSVDLLRTKLPKIFTCKSSIGNMLLFLLGKYLGVE